MGRRAGSEQPRQEGNAGSHRRGSRTGTQPRRERPRGGGKQGTGLGPPQLPLSPQPHTLRDLPQQTPANLPQQRNWAPQTVTSFDSAPGRNRPPGLNGLLLAGGTTRASGGL